MTHSELEAFVALSAFATPAGGGLTELIAKWRRHAKNMRIDGLMDCADELEATLAASPVPLPDAKLREMEEDAARLDWLEALIAKGKVEIARSILGTGYEFGHWAKSGPFVTVKKGTLRAAIDAKRLRKGEME